MFGLFKKKVKVGKVYLIEYPSKAVNAIKAVRCITGCGLKEAKELVDSTKNSTSFILIYEFDPTNDYTRNDIFNIIIDYGVGDSFIVRIEEV